MRDFVCLLSEEGFDVLLVSLWQYHVYICLIACLHACSYACFYGCLLAFGS